MPTEEREQESRAAAPVLSYASTRMRPSYLGKAALLLSLVPGVIPALLIADSLHGVSYGDFLIHPALLIAGLAWFTGVALAVAHLVLRDAGRLWAICALVICALWLATVAVNTILFAMLN